MVDNVTNVQAVASTDRRSNIARAQPRHATPSQNSPVAYAYLTPLMLILAAFMFYPLVASVILSFTNPHDKFIGFANYGRVLQGGRFDQNIQVTVLYAVAVVIVSMVLGLLAAHLITTQSRVINFLRPLYLVPWIIPSVASSIMFRSLLDGQAGPIPTLVNGLTGWQFYPLADFTWTIWFVILHEIWRCFPFVMLFVAAGLTTIHPSIHEAATIDGASRLQRFFYITIPILRGHLFVVMLMVTNFTLQSAETIYSMTQGGPGYATETLGVRIFKTAFNDGQPNVSAVSGRAYAADRGGADGALRANAEAPGGGVR